MCRENDGCFRTKTGPGLDVLHTEAGIFGGVSETRVNTDQEPSCGAAQVDIADMSLGIRS